METKKAKALADFLNQGLTAFYKLFQNENIEKQLVDQYKRKFSAQKFIDRYTDFEVELVDNIYEYRDYEMILGYVNSNFGEYYDWESLEFDLIQAIIDNDFEKKFLLNLKKNLDSNIQIVSDYCDFDYTGIPKGPLADYYNRTISGIPSSYDFLNYSDSGPEIDERFEFKKMKAACNSMATVSEKILFIHERLFDFQQWLVEFDHLEKTKSGNVYKFSTLDYPNFEKQCGIELSRLTKIIELEKSFKQETSTNLTPLEINPVLIQGVANMSFDFIWKDTDTDMLELVAALYKKGSIQRKDGKPINRNEIVSLFETMLSFQIKDVEGKLTRATNRNDKTPFLDSLKLAFENFADEKEERQRKRK